MLFLRNATLAMLVVASAAAFAQSAIRVRGTITGLQGDELSVTTREGRDMKIELAKNVAISYTKAVKLADLKPDRVVVGTTDPRVAFIMRELYEPFVRTGNPILVMDNASAELTKYGANALLAARISFKVLRAGSGTPARYSSKFFGAPSPFAAAVRLPDFTFFMWAMLQKLPLQVHSPDHLGFFRESGAVGRLPPALRKKREG